MEIITDIFAIGSVSLLMWCQDVLHYPKPLNRLKPEHLTSCINSAVKGRDYFFLLNLSPILLPVCSVCLLPFLIDSI